MQNEHEQMERTDHWEKKEVQKTLDKRGSEKGGGKKEEGVKLGVK